MSESIAKNFMYNLLLQIVNLFIPLITVPYVSRILGKEGIGVYSYTLSIGQYFIILGTLGISLYGNRQIAYVRDNKEKMSSTFWSIVFLKIISTSVALTVYLLIFGFRNTYRTVYLIESISIVAAMIDISWLYMGLEDFKKIATRNLAVKITGVAGIFIFVKSYCNLYDYIFINVMMDFLGNLIIWMYIPKTISKVKVKLIKIKEHFIPALQVFVPQIAIQIYAVLDKSMLGSLANTSEVGLYDQSQKIVKLVLSLVTSLGVVMLPRMSNTYANGDSKKMNEYLNKSLLGVSYVTIPMAVGLAAISNEFVPWFFGPDFKSVSYLIIILTPILFFIAMSNVLGLQYLMPANRTREFTASVTIGAIINMILNFTLIPRYMAIGSCIATVVAEFSVTLVQYICLRKNINKRNFFTKLTKYFLAAMAMFIIVKLIGVYMGARIITTMIQVFIGIVIYIIILTLLGDEINFVIFRTVIRKFSSYIIRTNYIQLKKKI